MRSFHYFIAFICLPFFHCIGKRLGLSDQRFVNYLKENDVHYYYFFFSIGLICLLILWLENKFIWNRLFKLEKTSLNYWIISPGLASGIISTWNANSLVFDCYILCF